MPRISKRVVDCTEPQDKTVFVWDSELSGFGLKVTPSGRKVYVVQYRIGGRNGVTRRITLGKHGTVTAELCRTAAKRLLGQVSLGIDPRKEAKSQDKVPLLGVAIDRFLNEHVDTKLKPRTAQEYRRELELHVPTNLKRRQATAISKRDIVELHHNLREHPVLANRVVRLLSKCFNWLKEAEILVEAWNPCEKIDYYREFARERYLYPEELRRLSDVLSNSGENEYCIAAIRLLLLTGARLSEILTLRWEWIDFDNKMVRLPDSKTGAKTIYLNEPSLDVLKALPRFARNPFVIVGHKENSHLVNLQKPWRRIREKAGLHDVRLHDLRHTFASVGAAAGTPLQVVGILLGHARLSTTQRYAHLSANPMLLASDGIAARIDGAMSGDKSKNV